MAKLHNVFLLTLFMFSGFIQLCSMESELVGKKSELMQPVCDRSFFGLSDDSSDASVNEQKKSFLRYLILQDNLIGTLAEMVESEYKVRQIEAERKKYYKKYFADLLKNSLVNERSRKKIDEFLKDVEVAMCLGNVPLIATNKHSIAALLRNRRLIFASSIPRKKLKVIFKLIKSEFDEIKFFGKYLYYNYLINRRNNCHDKLSDDFNQYLKKLKISLVDRNSTFAKYFQSSISIIVHSERVSTFGQSVKRKGIKLTQEFLRQVDIRVRNEQRAIVESYDSEFFKKLIKRLDNEIYKKEMEQLPQKIRLKKNKRKRGFCFEPQELSKKTYDHGDEGSDFDEWYILESDDFVDVEKHVDCQSNDFIPDFCLAKKSPKRGIDGYHDGEFLEKESTREVIIINDVCNKMKIYLYLSDRKYPVNRKEVDYPICYTNYVNQWFRNSEKSLIKKIKFVSADLAEKLKDSQGKLNAKRIHRFSRHVDRFIDSHGIQQFAPSRKFPGVQDVCITIPGSVEFAEDKILRTCIFVYLIESETGTCYHRNIEFKDSNDIIIEYLKDGKYKVKLPPVEWALRRKK